MRTSFGHTIQAPRQLACLTGVFVERLWKESKSLVDTEKSSWQKLLAELEEEGYADLSINGHVLCATTACTFSTCQLPKVVREWCVCTF